MLDDPGEQAMPYADANGVKLYYEECGRGFPLLLAHEFGGDCGSWEDQMRFFSRRHRVIAYNARGFPPSDAPVEPAAYSQAIFVDDMAAVLRHLRIEQAHIAGLSMGSMTTLHFGLRYPAMARSLVIAGTGPGDSQRAKDRFGREVIEQRAERLPNGPLQSLRQVVVGRPLLADMADRLQAMRVPTLIVLGDEDHVCLDTGVWLKRVLPAAGLLVLPKTGHLSNIEEPARFNEAVAAFFAAVEDGRWPETPLASRAPY